MQHVARKGYLPVQGWAYSRLGRTTPWSAILALIVLAGCAGVGVTVDTLKSQGYQGERLKYVTATGERREIEDYEIWWKESRDGRRVAHFCIVPKIGYAGYIWGITVYVDDKEAWSYQSAPFGSRVRREGIQCVDSDPLPEGRLNYRVRYQYYH